MFSADVKGDVVLKGKKVKRDGATYVEFTSIDIDLKLADYTVRIDNLFNGNKELGLYTDIVYFTSFSFKKIDKL